MFPKQLSFTHIGLQKDESYSNEDSQYKEISLKWEFDVESKAEEQVGSTVRRFNGLSQVLGAKICRCLIKH